MQSGVFSRALPVHDSLGVPHDFRISFGKLGDNEWAVEIYAAKNESGEFDIVSSRTDGQVASGTITFNGDGSLASVSPGLINPIVITWKNEAFQSDVRFDWGKSGVPKGTVGATAFGDSGGMSQVSSASEVKFLDQNGVSPGKFNSIIIDEKGVVIAGFTNGSTKPIYKIPIADFINPDELKEVSGNAYEATHYSGQHNLKEAGQSGVGVIVSEALEQANVDVSEQLTNMIIAQQSYQASAKVIRTANEVTDVLLQSI